MDEEAELIMIEKKLKERLAGAEIEVEGAVNKLELTNAAAQQFLQILQQRRQRELPHRNVERRQAKLAREGAAAGRFDVNDSMRHVLIIVQTVRRDELSQIGKIGGNYFSGRFFPSQQILADFSELQIRLTRDDVMGEMDNRLMLDFVTDFR